MGIFLINSSNTEVIKCLWNLLSSNIVGHLMETAQINWVAFKYQHRFKPSKKQNGCNIKHQSLLELRNNVKCMAPLTLLVSDFEPNILSSRNSHFMTEHNDVFRMQHSGYKREFFTLQGEPDHELACTFRVMSHKKYLVIYLFNIVRLHRMLSAVYRTGVRYLPSLPHRILQE